MIELFMPSKYGWRLSYFKEKIPNLSLRNISNITLSGSSQNVYILPNMYIEIISAIDNCMIVNLIILI